MTEPSKVQRFWIPATFHFTRLSEESAEVVLASDYDVLRTENERLTYRQQVIADTVGEENWSLRKQLTMAQNVLCTAQDQIPPDMEGDSLSAALIKLTDQRRELKAQLEARTNQLATLQTNYDALHVGLDMARGNRDGLIKMTQALEEKLAAMTKERDEAYKLLYGARCIHCGVVVAEDCHNQDIGDLQLQAHIEVCEKHPMFKVRQQLATAQARCTQLEAALRTFARYVWDNEKKVCSPLSDDAKKWLVKYGDLLP